MKLSKYQLIIIAVALAIVIFVVLAFLGFFKKEGGDENPYLPSVPTTITLWGYDVGRASMNEIASTWTDLEPATENVKIEYREFTNQDEYEDELLQALAEGRGPDLFMVQSHDMYHRAPTLYPAPQTFISLQTFAEYFPQVAVDDAIFSSDEGVNQIYALPLSLDVLSLVYNQDMFDGVGIAFPPRTWEEVVAVSNQIKELGNQGRVARAGVALGGIRNSTYLDSLLYALFFQNKSEFLNRKELTVRFDDPAKQAIEFYMQFSNPLHPYYTWNESMKKDIDAFTDEDVAMIVGTLESVKEIREKNPFLRVGVSPLPQVSVAPEALRTTANYTLLGVSKQTAYPATAWYVARAFSMSALNDTYREQTNTYPALRQRIASYSGQYDDVVRSFLTARSWHKPEREEMVSVIEQILIDIRERGLEINRALKAGEEKINALYR